MIGNVKINAIDLTSSLYIFSNAGKAITGQVPSDSITYTVINVLTTIEVMPSNVTLGTFSSS